MDQELIVYRRLQQRLDRMPVGFPETESGVELRILQHFFNPEEAEIACYLSMLPEPVEKIYKRLNKTSLTVGGLDEKLSKMALKGSIDCSSNNGKNYYRSIPIIVGMYEFQVERLPVELAKEYLHYRDEKFDDELVDSKISLLRTIPVEKSLSDPEKYNISTYDDVRYLIENASGNLAVANCVCRQTKDLVGENCSKTDLRETCLILSPEAADYYVKVGIGRYTDKKEAMSILEKAQESGLVLQPINSEIPEAICCCCGDCCGILTAMKKLPNPVNFYASNYYAKIDSKLCCGCLECVKICNMDAAIIDGDIANINIDRCIGCGNCVVRCASNAIKLHKKDVEIKPQKTIDDMYKKRLMDKSSKLNILKIGLKSILKQKI